MRPIRAQPRFFNSSFSDKNRAENAQLSAQHQASPTQLAGDDSMNSPIYLSGDEVGLLNKWRQKRVDKGKRVLIKRGTTAAQPARRIVEPKINLAKVKIFPLGAQSTVAAGATEFTFSQTAQ